jgi:hypothetical protein
MTSTVYGSGTRKRWDGRVEPMGWRARAQGWGERGVEYVKEVVTDRRFQVAAVLLVASVFGAFAYFWVQTSRTIDAHLAGTLDDTASGVYTAPLTVRAGQCFRNNSSICASAPSFGRYVTRTGTGFE